MADATRASALQWFVRGGTLTIAGRPPVRVNVEPILVGRDPSCPLALDDREVSALHCELRAEGPGVLLRDLGSKNGTFVGGLRVREAHLTEACALQVGGARLSFEPQGGRERVDVGFEEGFGRLVGSAPRMRHLFRLLREVAPTELSVLVTGETGTGKELVAQALHEESARAAGPFVVVDCGSIPGPLAESLLFGHEKGAFTGATERKGGAFHDAHRGTIFLDELGELPLELQPKLLRALAERKVKRVGSGAIRAGRRAGGGRHASRPLDRHERRPLPQRSLLPPRAGAPRAAPAEGAKRGRAHPRRRRLCPARQGRSHERRARARDHHARPARLARQRARAGQRGERRREPTARRRGPGVAAAARGSQPRGARRHGLRRRQARRRSRPSSRSTSPSSSRRPRAT
jgi:hypothetical protein